MNASPIRLTILFLGAVVIVSLMVWGVFGRSRTDSSNVTVTSVTSPTPALASPEPKSTQEPTQQNIAADPEPSAKAIPSPSSQSNALPLGVTKDALNYDKDVYKKLPGIEPPLINTDGRNLGPEATEKLQAQRSPVPFPGTNFPAATGSVSPIPFPKSISELNQLLHQHVSPAPVTSGH